MREDDRKRKERLIENIAQPPRALGIYNTFVILLFGPGGWPWLFCGVFVIACCAGGLKQTWLDLTAFKGKVEQVSGKVTESGYLGFEVNERDVTYAGYEFTHNGVKFQGWSYGYNWIPKKGSQVQVEFPAGNPEVNRAKGRSFSKGGLLNFIPLVPAVVLGFIGLLGTRKANRWIHMLKNGVVADATLKEKKKTNTAVNNEFVYALIFNFEDEANSVHQIVIKTHDTASYLDEDTETVLYDRHRPDKAILFDEIKLNVSMNRPGIWDPLPMSACLKSAIIRLLIAVPILAFCLFLFSS